MHTKHEKVGVIDLSQLEIASQMGKNVVSNPRKLQMTQLPQIKQY